MVLVSIIMTVIFPIGVPLVLGWTLWRKRDRLYPRNKDVTLSVAFTPTTTVIAAHTLRMKPVLGPVLHKQVRFKLGSIACGMGSGGEGRGSLHLPFDSQGVCCPSFS